MVKEEIETEYVFTTEVKSTLEDEDLHSITSRVIAYIWDFDLECNFIDNYTIDINRYFFDDNDDNTHIVKIKITLKHNDIIETLSENLLIEVLDVYNLKLHPPSVLDQFLI